MDAGRVVLLTNSTGELPQRVSAACGLPQAWSRNNSEDTANKLSVSDVCGCLIEFGNSAALSSSEQVWDQELSKPLCFAFEVLQQALRAFRNKQRGTILLLAAGSGSLAAVGHCFLACMLRSANLEGASSGVRAVGMTCQEKILESAWWRDLLCLHIEGRGPLPDGSWFSLPGVSEERQITRTLPIAPASLPRGISQTSLAPVVVITGAARGIGGAIARTLAERGYNVALFDIDEMMLGKAVRALEERGFSVCGVTGDVRQRGDLESLANAALCRWGYLDGWVNNAAHCARGKIEDISAEQFQRTLDVNLRPAWHSAQIMAQTRKEGGGSILNVSSTAAFSAGLIYPGRYNAYAPYAASKAGLLALTRALAREAASRHLTVNALAPGPVMTELAREIYKEEELRELGRNLPAGRVALPEEIAAAAGFLLSPQASLITGQALVVDGGLSSWQLAAD